MTGRYLLITSALALSTIGIASAKSYNVTLTAPAKVGTITLKAGDYEVNVKGTQAVFTNDDGKSFAVPVKIEQNDKKFDNTSVDAQTKDGADTIREIDLGGSNTKLEFGQ